MNTSRRYASRLWVVGIVLAAAVAVGACGPGGGGDTGPDATNGDTTDTTDGGSDGLEAGEFIRQYTEHAFCSDTPECESKAGLLAILELACHPDAPGTYSFTDVVENASPSRYDYDAAKAQECLDQLRNAGRCEGYAGEGGGFLSSQPCSEVFQGKQTSGDNCTTDIECQGDLLCELGQSCPGTCRALAAEDESCANRDCADGLFCNGSDTCKPLKSSGSTCSGSDCASGLFCNFSTDPDPTCTELPEGEGDACRRGLGGDNCPGELVCQNGSCQDGAADGESCDSEDQHPPCVPGTRCVDGTCTEIVEAGESCANSKTCVLSHYCDSDSDTCEPRPVVGESCANPPTYWQGSDQNFCFRGTCKSGTCQLLAQGDMCESSGLFGSDNCENSYCETDGSPSTCTTLKSQGSECSGDAECEGDLECRDDGSGTDKCLPVCSAN